MSNYCCSCRQSCGTVAVVTSLIVGIIAAFLRFAAVITVTPAFLWVVLGVAVGYQTILLATSASGGGHECQCRILPLLQTGILGAILTSVVLLAIEFVATSIAGAFLTGAALAFFALIFTSTACLINCLRCDS